MIAASNHILTQLSDALKKLSNQEYIDTLELFSGASISQHTRHILEFYQCLVNQTGDVVCFDDRKRDKKLEQDLSFTLQEIALLKEQLKGLSTDRPLLLRAKLNNHVHEVQSSLNRELMYALEHAVHHMAIIKMGIMLSLPHLKIAADFGVAESTIAYRQECAQ
jgi:uncharacterized damage-inducible protein DinB